MKKDHWTMCAVIARTECMMLGGRKNEDGPHNLGKCIDRHVGYTGLSF